MIDRRHEDVRSLLGAFVLDAVSPLERRLVERHLESCDECAREARLLGEPASELAFLAGQDAVPTDVVDRVVRALPTRTVSRRRGMRLVAVLSAAAVLAVGGLATAFVRERAQTDRLVNAIGAGRQVRLEPSGGFTGRGVLYVSGGNVVLVLEDVPSPGRSRDYQLWSIRAGTPTSVGVFHARGRAVKTLAWRRGGELFAVTVEPEGGSRRPTTDPVLRGA